MKASDVMQRDIVTVSPTTKLQEVGKIIFGLKVAGVPVVKEKKLVGLITETDFLHKLYPSYQEFMEDYLHAKDFEAMEEAVTKILDLPAGQVMNKNVITVTADTPLLKVQSLMLVRGFGRVPVVDEKNHLLGLVSQGDIFRAVIGKKLPFEGDEQYHDWLSRHYDSIIDWKTRLAKEIPDLTALFRKEKVRRVLDVGCGTGMQSIALAKQGFEVVGLDRSSRMIYIANKNMRDLGDDVKKRLHVVNDEYINLDRVFKEKFDAAIFMGTSLAHDVNPTKTVAEINKILNKKAMIVCQLANFDKVINTKKRLFDFHIREAANAANEEEYTFLRFYDPKEDGLYTLNVSVFVRSNKKWRFKGMNAVSVHPLTKEKMTILLKKLGFSKIDYFGGEEGFFYDFLFRKPFKPTESDVLTVVGKRV